MIGTRNTLKRIWIAPLIALASNLVPTAQSEERLKVGVTTHAYYSWVANVARGTPVVPIPIIPAGCDPHTYQPKPDDLRRLAELQVLVAGGIGHDLFVERMLQATGNQRVNRIDLHQNVPLISYRAGRNHAHRSGSGGARQRVNPHTFISISGAIQQIYNIQKGLAKLLPRHEAVLRLNARRYTRTLRRMKAATGRRLLGAGTRPIATVHDGYAYLLQEFGLKVSLVIQPKHGIEPSANELASIIGSMRQAKIGVLFSEFDFPKRYVDLIRKGTDVRVYQLSHISRGPYTSGTFEKQLQSNLDTLVQALMGNSKGPLKK